jgi:DNA processing protein
VTSETSRGAHRLIQDGAALVEGWRDVIGQLPARWQACLRAPVLLKDGAAAGEPAPGGPEVARVLAALGEEPVGIDELIERSGIGSGRAAALLLELELEGRVRQLEGKRFVQAGRG